MNRKKKDIGFNIRKQTHKRHSKRTYTVDKSSLVSPSSSEHGSHYTLKATNFSAGGVDQDYEGPSHIQKGSFSKTRYSETHSRRMDKKSAIFPGGFNDSVKPVAHEKKQVGDNLHLNLGLMA
jgi:hypothetical protein